MAGSDELIKKYGVVHSPGADNPAAGLIILARIIARVHLARLASNVQPEPDNSQIDDKRSNK